MVKLLRLSVFILLLICCFSLPSYAQISGMVKSSETLLPLSDVNVSIPQSTFGTSSTAKGRFELPIKQFPVTVLFSALGYHSKSITYIKPDSLLIVHLEPAVLNMEEIIVQPDRTINPLTQSSPIARSIVSIEQLSDKSVTTAVELLRAETGVFVQQTSVGQGSLYIRGRAGRDVLYLFNGLRMNPSFVRSGQNQYFGAVDPFLIQKLEVYRGPVSVYYGSDALSGGVNISPIVKDFSAHSDFSGEIASFLNFDGNGEKSVHGKLAYQSPTFSLFAGGSYRDYEYYNMSSNSDEALWFPYDETISNADYQFKSFQLSSKIKTGDASHLTLITYNGQIPDAPRLDRQTLGFSIEELDQNELIRPNFGYYSNTSPLNFWGNTAEFRLRTDRNAFENVGIKAGFFRLKDFRKQQDYAFSNAPAYAIDEGNRDYTFAISDTTNFDRSTSNQFQVSVDIQSGITTNLYAKWGADISIDRVSSEWTSNFGEQRLPRYPDGSRYLLSGLFGQLDYAPSSVFSVELGLRYSHTFADIPFEGIQTERKFDPYQADFGQFTHAVGLTYALTDELTLLSNFSTGFRAPNVSDLAEIGVRRADQFQTPNTELEPEKTRNLDIGTMFQNDIYSMEIYTFLLHYSDKITRVETGNVVNEFGQVLTDDTLSFSSNTYNEVQNENAHSMNLFGVEFAGEYTNNDFVKTGLTFTYTWGNLINADDSTEPVDRIPPANGIFYVDYTPTNQLSIRPQARYAFAHRRISPSEMDDNRVSVQGTDGFVNLQLLVNMRPQGNVSIKFVADNIMDAAYREHASSLDGMGRNYTVSLRYTF